MKGEAEKSGRPRWLVRWLDRHQHPVSFWLHMAGIPMTIGAVAVALVQLKLGRWDLWWRPVVLLAVGYFVQWLGHRIEGNDMGEVILVKRLLGRPYVAVSERYGERDWEGNAETPRRRDAERRNGGRKSESQAETKLNKPKQS